MFGRPPPDGLNPPPGREATFGREVFPIEGRQTLGRDACGRCPPDGRPPEGRPPDGRPPPPPTCPIDGRPPPPPRPPRPPPPPPRPPRASASPNDAIRKLIATMLVSQYLKRVFILDVSWTLATLLAGNRRATRHGDIEVVFAAVSHDAVDARNRK